MTPDPKANYPPPAYVFKKLLRTLATMKDYAKLPTVNFDQAQARLLMLSMMGEQAIDDLARLSGYSLQEAQADLT